MSAGVVVVFEAGAQLALVPVAMAVAAAHQDTKIRVVLEGPPAPPSPVPEVNEVDEDSMRTGAHADGLSPAAAAAAAGTAAATARAGAGTGAAGDPLLQMLN